MLTNERRWLDWDLLEKVWHGRIKKEDGGQPQSNEKKNQLYKNGHPRKENSGKKKKVKHGTVP